MVELESHIVQGTSPDVVLIVAGIHTSEQSGVEVARWIRVKLAARPKPTRLSALVIPEVFPDEGKNARADEWKTGAVPGKYRETVRRAMIYPARHFPPPGKPLSFIKDGLLTDANGKALPLPTGQTKVYMLPEIAFLIRCVEALKPVRIVSVHGRRPRTRQDLKDAAGLIKMTADEIANWDEQAQTPVPGVNFPGIFVDPRYSLNQACLKAGLESCKFDQDADPAFPTRGTSKRFDSALSADGKKDDALARAAAEDKAFTDPALVGGNHLGPAPIVHYAKEPGTPSKLYSLGDWGPVDVDPSGGSPGSRRGAPVFTIEVKDDGESWSFADAIQVMKTDSSGALKPELTPDQRARKANVADYPTPRHWTQRRSSQLQQYADAIIDTILER